MRFDKLLAAGTIAFALAAVPAAAQTHTTPGAVMRVTTIDIKPGMNDAFWTDMRQNSKPIWEEQKKQGLISNYSVATKSTTDSPEDWDVTLTFTYPNWATLDTFGARNDPITLKHYGTAEKRTAAGRARTDYSRVVQSFLVRAQTVNDWKP